MNREARSTLAQETLNILRDGAYFALNGTRVDIAHDLQQSVQRTRLIRPDEWPAMIERARVSSQAASPATIEVTGETTLAAVRRLVVQENLNDVTALNFASAKNPGGGFLGGSQAQEENLARASGLYATLQAAPEYYQLNRISSSAIYTDHAIYSPHVPIFRDDDGVLLEPPYRASFITMPAVNAGALKAGSSDTARVMEVMAHRINCVLALAIEEKHRSIVLGAWGCGVFTECSWDDRSVRGPARNSPSFTTGIIAVMTFRPILNSRFVARLPLREVARGWRRVWCRHRGVLQRRSRPRPMQGRWRHPRWRPQRLGERPLSDP